jgi:hypothetical protein
VCLACFLSVTPLHNQSLLATLAALPAVLLVAWRSTRLTRDPNAGLRPSHGAARRGAAP